MSLIGITTRSNHFAQTARTSPSRFDGGSDAPPKSENDPASKEHKTQMRKSSEMSLPFTSKAYFSKNSKLTPRMSMERDRIKKELNDAKKDNLPFKSYIFGINAPATERNILKGSPEE